MNITLFLSGDVMTGRGIDQVLPFSSDPTLHESYMTSALGYVQLAETANGPISKPVNFDYIWGDAISLLDKLKPDFRIINLETSITTSNAWEPKGINYRMHPQNVPCLTAAKISCCVLANNHILDWGISGMTETLQTLNTVGIKTVGAGRTLEEAKSPAILTRNDHRVILFSLGSKTSGIPPSWAATTEHGGVNFIKNVDSSIHLVQTQLNNIRRPNDIVVVSIHRGSNWGYEIPEEYRSFAKRLIDAGVDVIHGHSSHHVKGVEVYKNKLILYGCGDLITDYEGISGHEEFRGDLGILYFPTIDSTNGALVSLEMFPMQMKRFRLKTPSAIDIAWLTETLNREGRKLKTHVMLSNNNAFYLNW